MSNPNHEEKLYAQAAAELEDGNRDEGLWAKCFAECDGDENKAKARYIKTRAERLAVDEIEVGESKRATWAPSKTDESLVTESDVAIPRAGGSEAAGPKNLTINPRPMNPKLKENLRVGGLFGGLLVVPLLTGLIVEAIGWGDGFEGVIIFVPILFGYIALINKVFD
ncbi:hypothetical protein OAL58_03645 [Verrucomicrobia bacterium]|nr:hypothetical protein [Verrucomicrobiota bacterium]